MRILQENEIVSVSGGAANPIVDKIGAITTGFIDGFGLGIIYGGKWGGSGGFIAGGILQLAGLIVVPIPTALAGAVFGMFFTEKQTRDFFAKLRTYALPGENGGHGSLS